MLYFFLFFSELLLLFLLSRMLTRAISGAVYQITHSMKLSVHVLSFLFFPGTVIHELAHAIMAGVLGVHVGKMEFVPKIEGNTVKMGSVQIAHTDIIRRFFIGIAPFLTGATLILGILYFAAQQELFDNWLMIAVIVYAVFEIGNTMFSSKKDMEGAIELLGGLAVIIIVLYLLGVRIPAINPDILVQQPLVAQMLQKGTLFLLVPIIIDIVVLGIFKILRK